LYSLLCEVKYGMFCSEFRIKFTMKSMIVNGDIRAVIAAPFPDGLPLVILSRTGGPQRKCPICFLWISPGFDLDVLD
jgi:hypothetical protein